MFDPNKPYKSYEERIEIIKSKNIKILTSENSVKRTLKNVSYYALINGYKDVFLDKEESLKLGKDYCMDGTYFEYMYTLFLVNTNIHHLILKQLVAVERVFKTKLSDHIASTHGVTPTEYMDNSNYSNTNNKLKSVIKSLNDSYYKFKENSSTTHYKRNHNHVPPWIIINELKFYDSINWYSCLKPNEKESVCNDIIGPTSNVEDGKELLVKALNLTREYRNSIAHGNRTFKNQIDTRLPKNPLLNKIPNYLLTEKEYLQGLGVNDIYSILLSIFLIIDEPSNLSLFILDLKRLLDSVNVEFLPGKNIYDILEIPTDTVSRFERYINEKYI